jgi:hypothetical protein
MAETEADNTDYQEEILISVLAKKHALITIEELLKLKKSLYFSKVKTILEKM